MKKNLMIVILTIALIVVAYKYAEIRSQVTKDNNVLNAVEQMKLCKGHNGQFYVVDDDENFFIEFYYDKNGLQAFNVKDSFSNKRFGFNFWDGILTSYMYDDDTYSIKTNLFLFQPERLIQREEWFKGILTFYELLPDETATVTTERVERDKIW